MILSYWKIATLLHICAMTAAQEVHNLDVQQRPFTHSIEPRNRIRQNGNTAQSSTRSDSHLLYINITVGTPPQEVELYIAATGDSYVYAKNASCESNSCGPFVYDQNASSTFNPLDESFFLGFVDGSNLNGTYVQESVGIGGKTLNRLKLGLGYDLVDPDAQGGLGLGYPTQEVGVLDNNRTAYENPLQAMVSDGIIRSRTFSLYLNDLPAPGTSASGSLTFGGIDLDKFDGDLRYVTITPPTSKTDANAPSFNTQLTRIGIGKTNFLNTSLSVVSVDMGSSLTYLPRDVCDQMYEAVGAKYDDSQQVAFIECGKTTNDTIFQFDLTGPVVNVTMRQLVLDPGASNSNGSICVFGVAPSNDSILGLTFLRNAYVVFDLDNNEITFAQSRLNATSSNIVEISGKAADWIPRATTSPTSTSTPNSTSSSTPGGKALSPGAKAGVAIGSIGGALLIIGAVVLLVRGRRAKNSGRPPPSYDPVMTNQQPGPWDKTAISPGAQQPHHSWGNTVSPESLSSQHQRPTWGNTWSPGAQQQPYLSEVAGSPVPSQQQSSWENTRYSDSQQYQSSMGHTRFSGAQQPIREIQS